MNTQEKNIEKKLVGKRVIKSEKKTFYKYVIIVSVIIVVITSYMKYKSQVSAFINLLSGGTVIIGIFGYLDANSREQENKEKEKSEQYVNYVSRIFTEIDSLFTANPKELEVLFYEFYGYTNFPTPISVIKENEMAVAAFKSTTDVITLDGTPIPDYRPQYRLTSANKHFHLNNVTPFEYITILIIIEKIAALHKISPEFGKEKHIKNRIKNMTTSKKFGNVWLYCKYNYSEDFIQYLEENNFVSTADPKSVNIPYYT